MENGRDPAIDRNPPSHLLLDRAFCCEDGALDLTLALPAHLVKAPTGMRQNWYIIDRWGRRSVNCRTDSYWSRFDYGAIDIDWPEFNQLITRASADAVVMALRTFAGMLDVDLIDVTDSPERWEGAIIVAQNGGSVVVSEPGVELDDRLMRPESADAVCGLLAHDGAFFGYDPTVGTVHITTYELGVMTLDWWDSVAPPGPAYARTFIENGRAQDEDPRPYALRVLGMPESSPLLDRYAFVEHLLTPFELDSLQPNLDSLKILWALRLG